MKTVLSLFAATALFGCATSGPTTTMAIPTYESARLSEFTHANYQAIEKIIATASVPIDKSVPILVATVVNIDSMQNSSRFGRLISEQMATRLTQLGFHVVEMKLRNDLYISEGTGELLLSRDMQKLSKNYNAQIVIVGSYAPAATYTYMTIKAVMPYDNRIVSATNYLIPVGNNTQALLAGK